MRTSVGFTSPPSSSSSSTTSTSTTSISSSTTSSHSPWHSPVPYLFGGLAAMLGLIAFALLILACSYWKLSGYLDGEEQENSENGSSDATEGKGGDGKGTMGGVVYEERIVVIMAGEEKPTYLATPITSRASSFAHSCSSKSMEGGGDKGKNEEVDEEEKKANGTTNGGEEEEEEDRQVNHTPVQ